MANARLAICHYLINLFFHHTAATPLSWNEIKSRADAFTKEWEGEAKRIEFLFELYDKYTAGLFVKEKKGSKKKG